MLLVHFRKHLSGWTLLLIEQFFPVIILNVPPLRSLLLIPLVVERLRSFDPPDLDLLRLPAQCECESRMRCSRNRRLQLDLAENGGQLPIT